MAIHTRDEYSWGMDGYRNWKPNKGWVWETDRKPALTCSMGTSDQAKIKQKVLIEGELGVKASSAAKDWAALSREEAVFESE